MDAKQEGASARGWITPFEFAAIAYLTAPVALFFIMFAKLPVALGVAAALAFALWLCFQLTDRKTPIRLQALDAYYIALAMLAVFLSGSFGGGFFPNNDWKKHFAMFQFLIDNDALTGSAGGEETVSLSYYLAWYVVPALVTKWLGQVALLPAIGVWTSLGLYLFFRIAAQLVPSSAWRYALPVVFLLFSGADAIGRLLSGFMYGTPDHFEWWAGWVQYSSMLTDLFWAPQHALSAWLGIALAIRLRSDPAGLTVFPLVTAATLLWSPFSAAGLAPFFIWSMLCAARAVRLPIVLNALLMLGVSLLILNYLLAGRGADHMILVSVFDYPCLGMTRTCFTYPHYLRFIGVEVLGFLAILHIATRGRDPLLWISTLVLLLLPFGRYGVANDLNLHVSIPALALLAIVTWQTLHRASLRMAIAIICLLLAGAATPLGEAHRAFVMTSWPYPGMTLSKLIVNRPDLRAQYIAQDASWMMRAPSN